jgi:hypothetical protein
MQISVQCIDVDNLWCQTLLYKIHTLGILDVGIIIVHFIIIV